MSDTGMNIVYGCSDMYTGVFAVSVTSLFETNRSQEMTVYLLDGGISEENLRRIQQIAADYQRRIVVIPMPSVEELAAVHLELPRGFNLSTYGRLFLSSILPKSIDKVLYIDSDTLIRGLLNDLYALELGDSFAAMADDGHSMAYRRMLGLRDEGRYFSAGITLINLKKWRETKIEKAFIRYIQSQFGYIPLVDQGVLNAVCDGKLSILPLKYNVYTAIIAFDYREFLKLRSLKCFYSQQEYDVARKDPVIVHFMTNFFMPLRPWQKGCTHPYVREYLRYRERTPWRDEPLWDDSRTAIQKLYSNFSHRAPRKLMIQISAFIHEHVIWMKHAYRKQKAKCKMVKSMENL